MKTAREKLIVAKNSFANLIRGGASAIVALLLPAFLARSMSPVAYGAWVLVLQLSAYVGYVDFGIQTAVGRFVAHSSELRDNDYRDRIVSTSLAILTILGTVAFVGILALAALLPVFFKHLPTGFLHEMRIALILVGGSLAVGLPASIFNGIFVGMQRHEIPAVIIGATRLAGAVFVVLVVRHGGGLVQMGAVMASANLISYGLQYWMYRRVAPDIQMTMRMVSKATARELAQYCLSLTTWSLALLLVTGLDLTIVGIYRFQDVAYYSVAATLVMFVAGMYNAIFSPMIPATAVMHARGDSPGMGRMVVVTTRYGMFLLLITGLPLIFGAAPLLALWVGPEYALHARLLVEILVIANIIRLSATSYVIAMIGSGEQRLVILTPLLEGITNLIISIIGGYYWGGVGVAIGTVAGAVVGVVGNLIYNMPRTAAIHFSIREYIRDSLLRPVLCSGPVLALACCWHLMFSVPATLRIGILVATIFATAWALWTIGLMPIERRNMKERVWNAVS